MICIKHFMLFLYICTVIINTSYKDMLRHTGKIRKVKLARNEEDDFFMKKCNELGIIKAEKYDTYEDALFYESDIAKVVRVNGEIWEVVNDKTGKGNNARMSFFILENDGTYDFLIQYDALRDCFGEQLENLVRDIQKYEIKKTI